MKEKNKDTEIDQIHKSLKIPLYHRNAPYVYIRANNSDRNYRLSANYEYLNKHYELKMKFIRDFKDIKSNYIFTIKDKIIISNDKLKWQTWNIVNSDSATLQIKRFISNDSKSSIIILKREFDEDVNYSIFFCSEKYYTLQELLGETNGS